MAENVFPWLHGLDGGGWTTVDENATGNVKPSSASHDAADLHKDNRMIKHNFGDFSSATHVRRPSSQASVHRSREPLANLSTNDTNGFHRASMDPIDQRSTDSSNSTVRFGTVQFQTRSPGSSPMKKSGTLEWRKRLLQGKVEYGDQTDLFGPSGLENLFTQSGGKQRDSKRGRSHITWRARIDVQDSEAAIPSSPPLWPIRVPLERSSAERAGLPMQEREHSANGGYAAPGASRVSLESNRADLIPRTSLAGDHDPSTTPGRVSRAGKHLVEERAFSSEALLDQEDFSPVYLTKHTSTHGSIKYAAIKSHLHKAVDDHGIRDQKKPQHRQKKEHVAAEDDTDLAADISIDGPDLSLSENLPTGTPPVAALSTFVQTSRGGHSADGSFHLRPLSPSPSKDSTMEQSIINETLMSNAVEQHPIGQAEELKDNEYVSTLKTKAAKWKARSSASPLKLFATHDTFTSNCLLRRLTQLEAKTNASHPVGEPAKAERDISSLKRRIESYGSFGSGELNDYAFDAPVSDVKLEHDEHKAFSDSSESIIADTKEAKNKAEPGSRLLAHAEQLTLFKTRRPEKLVGSERVDIQPLTSFDVERHYEIGKRPPNSPSKCPAPKRRRTLHFSEIEPEDKSYGKHPSENEQTKDGQILDGSVQAAVAEDEYAARQTLRPRNPTPETARQEQVMAELKEATEEFAAHSLSEVNDVVEQIEASIATENSEILQEQAVKVANQVAAFTLKVSRPSEEYGERKRSVTTQDFLDEAIMVMNLIRANARPQSGLGSLEESDAENLPRGNDANLSESLRISRPPSRNGRHSGWRSNTRPNDARIVSHLRKFQDDDKDDFISSEESESFSQDEESSSSGVTDEVQHGNNDVDPATARLEDAEIVKMNSPELDEAQSRPVSQRSRGSTVQTHHSETTSTLQTMCTNISKKSDNVGTLGLDAVAHLIGEQVGAMTFDREQQKWIRVKKDPDRPCKDFLEAPSHVTSDDDPFREISDLPVDELDELRRVSAASKVDANSNTITEAARPKPLEKEQSQKNSRQVKAEDVAILSPTTIDSNHPRERRSSTLASRATFLASSQQGKTETRATSWSEEGTGQLKAPSRATTQLRTRQEPGTAITHQLQPGAEILEVGSILESQGSVAIVKEPKSTPIDDDASTSPDEECDINARSVIIQKSDSGLVNPHRRLTTGRPTFVSSTPRRQVSLRRKTLTGRLMAVEAEDETEMSLIATIPSDRVVSLSLSVTKPLSTQPWRTQIVNLQSSSSPDKLDPSFYLSDLPDFTLHEEDVPRPSEQRLAVRLAQYAANEVHDRYALAVRELVKTLTDVEEVEPYWEDLKQLDLHGRSLVSIYGLEDFCPRIQDIVVSQNSITHLNGAPTTIRSLDANSNQLSNLTAWNHLPNLQYLDVSHNEIDDLTTFRDLIHLRELTVDNNNIQILEPLDMAGLLRLSLRGNRLAHINVDNCQLAHLEHLDLSDNQINSVQSLHLLPRLKSLVLDGNASLDKLHFALTLPCLETLSVRRGSLHDLDVGKLPKLRYLYVDDNCLTRIRGLQGLPNLEVLSMRRQKLPKGQVVSVFDVENSARRISLTGSTIQSFDGMVQFLNLQHLELASTGLRELPMDFGIRMPNLRDLNINFNFIRDLRPLLNTDHLAHLSVCGNRLDRLRKSVVTLAKMKSLRSLDLRDNPITQAFYPSLTTIAMQHETTHGIPHDKYAEIEMAEQIEASKHHLPEIHADADDEHQSRMDASTRMRRRVYELLLVNSCPTLERLDGLSFDHAKAGSKDEAFERLMELGIIRRSKVSRDED